MDSEQGFKTITLGKDLAVHAFYLVAPAQSEGQAVVMGFITEGWVAVVAFVESQLEVEVGDQVYTKRAVEL